MDHLTAVHTHFFILQTCGNFQVLRKVAEKTESQAPIPTGPPSSQLLNEDPTAPSLTYRDFQENRGSRHYIRYLSVSCLWTRVLQELDPDKSLGRVMGCPARPTEARTKLVAFLRFWGWRREPQPVPCQGHPAEATKAQTHRGGP